MATIKYRVIDSTTQLFLRDDVSFDSATEEGIITDNIPYYGTYSYWDGTDWSDTRTQAEKDAQEVSGVPAYNVKTNSENISTNATNISTNATNITTLQSDVVDLQAQIDGKRYGIDINETTGDVTRLYDAVGMTIGSPDGTTAITSDFDSVSIWFEMRHVKVADDGTISEQTDDDYDTFNGEIMTYIPQFYYKDWRENDHRYCVISNKALNGYSKAWQDKEYGLCASFPVSYDTDYHSEIAGAPKVSTSYTDFINGFYSKGDGEWSMYDSNMLHNLFLLSCIEAGSLNHKGSYGHGINSSMPYSSSSNYELVADTINGNTVTILDASQPFYVGMLVQIGTSYTNNSIASDRYITDISTVGSNLEITVDGDSFTASIGDAIASWGQPVSQTQYDAIGDGSGYYLQFESENRSHVCYRGIWDLWGNAWQFNAGFMRKDGEYYGSCNKTSYAITDPDGADGWADLGIGEYADNGYQKIREAIKVDGGSVDVPIEWGSTASSETFYSAYLYNFSSAYTGVRVLRVGGYWSIGSGVSLVFSIGSYTPSVSGISVGARLIR